jgi:hypothetical protein
MQQDPAFITMPALAKRWSVSTSTIERRVRARCIPTLRIGRAVRIALRDVEAIEGSALSIAPERPRPYVDPERLADLDKKYVEHIRAIMAHLNYKNPNNNRVVEEAQKVISRGLVTISTLLAAYGEAISEGDFENVDLARLSRGEQL